MEAADPMQATGEIEVQDVVDGVGVDDGDVGEVESIAGTTAEEIEDAAGEAMDDASQSDPEE